MGSRRWLIGVVGLLAAACGASSNGTPNSPSQTTLALSGTATVTSVSQTSQLTLTATQGTSTTTVTNQAIWTSSNTGVATVSSSGLVTATGFGSATITAAYQGSSQTLAFAVSMSGTWGVLDPGGGGETIALVMTETGANITGTMTFTPGLPTGDTFSTDTITGTITGSAFTWTLTLTPGSDPNMPSCAGVQMTFTGTGTINAAGTSMLITGLTAQGVCDKKFPGGSAFQTGNEQITFTKS